MFTYQHSPETPNILVHCHLVNLASKDVVRLYMRNSVIARRLQPVFDHYCTHCLGQDLRFSAALDIMTCASCGTVHGENCSLGEEARWSKDFSGRPRDHSDNVYKRVNHFKFWLLRLQGGESHRVNPETLAQIKEVLDENPTAEVTYDRIRDALKRLHFQRYYNNTYSIMRLLTGHALVDLTPLHEKQLLEMFLRIQRPFAKNRESRVNMLGYMYLLRKFCEILGWRELAVQLPHLKSREKTRSQDIIWRKICHDLSLPFYRSVS